MAPGRTPLSGASDPRKRDGTIVRIGPARPFGRECSALALFARSLGVRSRRAGRSEEHTSELQSLMRISYAVFCLKKKNNHKTDRKEKYITESILNTQITKSPLMINK